MKAVLASIKPQYCCKIATGEKLIEIRKNYPNLSTPFKCYIYCTTGKVLYRSSYDGNIKITKNGRDKSLRHHTIFNCKVIGEFICDEITPYFTEFYDEDNVFQAIYQYADEDKDAQIAVATNDGVDNGILIDSCLTFDEIKAYIGCDKDKFYGWHISNLVIYDKPKELREFYIECQMNCEHCEMWGYTRVNADEFDMDCKSDWFNHKPLKRPPQSWCYVEEVRK